MKSRIISTKRIIAHHPLDIGADAMIYEKTKNDNLIRQSISKLESNRKISQEEIDNLKYFIEYVSKRVLDKIEDLPYQCLELFFLLLPYSMGYGFSIEEVQISVVVSSTFDRIVSTKDNDELNALVNKMLPVLSSIGKSIKIIKLSSANSMKIIHFCLVIYFSNVASSFLQSIASEVLFQLLINNQNMIEAIFGIMNTLSKKTKASIEILNGRTRIYPVTRLIFGIIDSISHSNIVSNQSSATEIIIQKIISNLSIKHISIFQVLIEDSCRVVDLFLYPSSFLILKYSLTYLFAVFSNKSFNHKIIVELICNILVSMIKLKECFTPMTILTIPNSIWHYFCSYFPTKIPKDAFIIVKETNVEISFQNIILFDSSTFMLISFIILSAKQQYIKAKCLKTYSTASFLFLLENCFLELFDFKLYQLLDTYLPQNQDYCDISSFFSNVYKFLLSKNSFVLGSINLLKHLVSLDNLSSVSFCIPIIKSIVTIIDFFPELLSFSFVTMFLNSTFKLSSNPIQIMILDIVYKQLQNNQTHYFPILINSLNSKSITIIKKAFDIISNVLSKGSIDNDFIDIIINKIEDMDQDISKLAKKSITLIMLKDCNALLLCLKCIFTKFSDPKWLDELIKEVYTKAKNIILEAYIMIINSKDLSYSDSLIILSLSSLFPNELSENYCELIHLLVNCNNNDIIPNLCESIVIMIDNVSSFNKIYIESLCNFTSNLISNQGKNIIEPIIKLVSRVLLIWEPNSSFFDKIKNQIENGYVLDSSPIRSVFILACIYRYFGGSFEIDYGKSLLSKVLPFFSKSDAEMKSLAISAIKLICCQDPTLVIAVNSIIDTSLRDSSIIQLRALEFLESIIKIEINGLSSCFSSANILKEMSDSILACTISQYSYVRNTSMRLIYTTYFQGFLTPHTIVSYLLVTQCFEQQKGIAESIIKHINNDNPIPLINSVKNSLIIVMNNINSREIRFDPSIFSFYMILSSKNKRTILKEIINICNDMVTSPCDSNYSLWVFRCFLHLQFSYQWEPSTLIEEMVSSNIIASIGSLMDESKEMVDECIIHRLYSAVNFLRYTIWLKRKFNILINGIRKSSFDQKPCISSQKIDLCKFLTGDDPINDCGFLVKEVKSLLKEKIELQI